MYVDDIPTSKRKDRKVRKVIDQEYRRKGGKKKERKFAFRKRRQYVSGYELKHCCQNSVSPS